MLMMMKLVTPLANLTQACLLAKLGYVIVSALI
jgi:hypothetical protein